MVTRGPHWRDGLHRVERHDPRCDRGLDELVKDPPRHHTSGMDIHKDMVLMATSGHRYVITIERRWWQPRAHWTVHERLGDGHYMAILDGDAWTRDGAELGAISALFVAATRGGYLDDDHPLQGVIHDGPITTYTH